MKKLINNILPIFKDRVFFIFVFVLLMFAVVTLQYYRLQIIEHNKYANDLRASVERQIEIPATRGLIFDRYGRPLAINKPTNVIKFDQQVKMRQDEVNRNKDQLNQVLLDVANIILGNNDKYIDNIPISEKPPFVFTGSETEIRSFLYNIPADDKEHREELATYTAPQLFKYLRDIYQINEEISDEDARKIVALRTEIYKLAYYKYKLVTLAMDVSPQTVAMLEENHSKYPGINVDVQPVRYYPEGELLGNIIGYTRTITEAQYENMKGLGYDKDDIVGQMGIEESMESELRGQKGIETAEVDDFGRRVRTIDTQEAVKGNNVFLTIDLDLQRDTYNSIQKRLSEAIVERLKGGSNTVKALSGKDVIISMVESNQLSITQMEKAQPHTKQREIYDLLHEEYMNIDEYVRKEMSLKHLLLQWLEEDNPNSTLKDILLAMHEQKTIQLSDDVVNSIQNSRYGNVEGILIGLFESGNLTPSQMAVDPFSASAVVTDVNTGEVLAIVGYPSFDSNQMISNFNSYYSMLSDDMDKRSILLNRAVRTPKAPGSTFKMISGIAGLEEGVVTPSTVIYDTGTFTKAGSPYPRCWVLSSSGGGHGTTDIYRALEVSCNYYFYEVAYRLNQKSKTPYGGIETLTKYVDMFGLNEKSGIEISETSPNVSTPKNLVKTQITMQLNYVKNMDEEERKSKSAEIRKALEKGIYPLGDASAQDINGKIDYLIQYELKRNIDPILQDALAPYIDEIIQESLADMQSYLQQNPETVTNDIVSGVMNDLSATSLRTKTKSNLTQSINKMMTDAIDKAIQKSLAGLDENSIIDAYEYAYTVLYRRELRQNTNPELVSELNKRIDELDSQKDYYKQYVAKKVKDNLSRTIADNLLSNSELDWTDGATVRTAIGQEKNAYTPVQIARYIAGIANGKELFDLKLVNGIYDEKGTKEYVEKPVKKNKDLTVSEDVLKVIHEGMLRVTKGSQGTARNYFTQMPFDIAGKTGTAQEGTRHEHAWFVGFTPYDKPEIAVVVSIYNADGLGKYGSIIAEDILKSYYRLDEPVGHNSLDNTFRE